MDKITCLVTPLAQEVTLRHTQITIYTIQMVDSYVAHLCDGFDKNT